MKTTIVPHPVEEAKKHTSALETPETTKELDEQIAHLKTHFGGALPVESGNRASVTTKIAALEMKKNDRIIVDTFPNARVFHPEKPLGWRDKDGMPVLAPFGLDDPICEFSHEGLRFHRQQRWGIGPHHVDVAARLYRPFGGLCEKAFWLIPILCGALAAQLNIDSSFSSGVMPATIAFWVFAGVGLLFAGLLFGDSGKTDKIYYVARHLIAQATFQGLIPKPARAVILKAQEAQKSGLLKDVFLLAEVPKWEIALSPKPVRTWIGCPLIIAFDGEKHWLLDSFNVTSVEMMAAGYTENRGG